MRERSGSSRLTARQVIGARTSLWLLAALLCSAPSCSHNSPSKVMVRQSHQLREEVAAKRAKATELARQAGARIRRGEYEAAEPLLIHALQEDAFCFAAHNNRGLLYLHQGDYYQAVQSFQEAAMLEPSLHQPHYNIAHVLERTGHWEEAAKEYELSLDRKPDHLASMEQLAQCYIRLGRDLARAEELLERASKLENCPHWLQWIKLQQMALRSRERSSSSNVLK